MIALIDGDIIAYQATTAAFKVVDWEDGEGPQPLADIPGAIDTAIHLVHEWTRLAGAKSATVCFSPRDGSNFRKLIEPSYKAGRPEKPPGYWEVVDAVEAAFKFYRIDGLEADDVMGIAGTDGRFGQTVVVSLDKDMKTLPALVFNPTKDVRPQKIAPAQADLVWMTQTLTGDPVDGYKGCPKIGPVNAARILGPHWRNLGALWKAVVETYEAAGLSEADALLQARLARILRAGDYNHRTKEVNLWHLTTPEPIVVSGTPPNIVNTPSATASESAGSSPSRRSGKQPRKNRKRAA